MAYHIVQHSIQGYLVPQGSQDGYVNATRLAKVYEKLSGKRRDVRDWLETKRTKETLHHLYLETGIPVSKLIIKVKGRGDVVQQGTYIHPQLAVRFAIWLSDEFGFEVERIVREWFVNGAGNPQWHVEREKLKDSNDKLTSAIKAYIDLHGDEWSQNRKNWVYKVVNDRLCMAIAGCNVAKFKRTRHTDSFRESLSKDELKSLEHLEALVIRLIENNVNPYDAVADAKQRLMLD